MAEYKSRFGLAGLTLIAAMTGSGCGTMFDGTTQYIPINSQPPGAVTKEVDMETNQRRFIGYTPCTYKASRKSPNPIILEKEGYESQSQDFTRSFNGKATLNLLCGVGGIIIGGPIDFFTGGIYKVKPNRINVGLQKTEGYESITKPSKSEPEPIKKETPTKLTLKERLEKLKKLFENEDITSEEYDSIRKRILGEL